MLFVYVLFVIHNYIHINILFFFLYFIFILIILDSRVDLSSIINLFKHEVFPLLTCSHWKIFQNEHVHYENSSNMNMFKMTILPKLIGS